MQAIILAAGEGTRMRPITYDVPKPMVKANGKTLVERNIEKLPKEVTELIIVVGYLKEKIMSCFGNEFGGRKITYVEQDEPLGTAHAVSLCKDYVNERFIVMMSDDAYSKEDFVECLKHERAILAKRISGKSTAGKITCDENGNMIDILEGIHEDADNGILANTNFFVLTPEYFDYKMVSIKDGKEYGLPQTVVNMSKDYPVKIVEASNWMKIDSMDDVAEFEKELRKN